MTDSPPPIIDTQRLSDEDAAGLGREAGCLVARIGPDTRGRPVYVEADQADAVAANMASQSPGQLYGVFKPARIFHAQPKEPSDAT